MASTSRSVISRRALRYSGSPVRLRPAVTTSTPGSPARVYASFRASSPYLVANSTACRPTRPAPMISTLTVECRGPASSGQVRSSAANAAETPFQATLRRFSTSRRPSSLRMRSRLIASIPMLAEHPDARGAGGEVEHGHEDGAPAQAVVLALGCAKHDDDVLAVAVVLVGDHHVRRQHAVVEVRVAHPGADAALDVHLGAVGGQQADQRRAGSRAVRSARGASAGSRRSLECRLP